MNMLRRGHAVCFGLLSSGAGEEIKLFFREEHAGVENRGASKEPCMCHQSFVVTGKTNKTKKNFLFAENEKKAEASNGRE